MERLVLEDGAAIEPKDEAFCKRLQNDLMDQNKAGGIIVPKDWFPNWGNRKIGKLELFGYFQKTYRVQRFVGFLGFEGRQVLIHPRFDKTGALFRYMMTRLGLMPRLAWNHSTDAEIGGFQAPLVYMFLRQLKDAYSIGVYRQYQTFSYNDTRPKGYINVPLHIRKNPVENGCVAYSTREYTVDNPVNRLILITWQYICEDQALGKIAHRIIQTQPELYAPIRELNYQLNSPYIERKQVLQIIRAASGPITHHMHQRYERVRKTALLILKGVGPEQAANKGESRVSGMLFPMDIMWEFFLEKTVLSFDRKHIEVSSQETFDILITEGGVPLRSMKPDFLLQQKGDKKVVAVLDAKYKKIWGSAYTYFPAGSETDAGVSDDEEEDSDQDNRVYSEKRPWKDARIREDSFQVMSYMHVTHAKTGGILFPMVTKEKTLPVKKLRLYQNMEDRILLIPVCLPEETGNFDTYRAEMDERCALLQEELKELFSLNDQDA